MSIMLAALNPNISDSQLLELVRKDGENKQRMIETFSDCVNKLETDDHKKKYIEICLPILVQFLSF